MVLINGMSRITPLNFLASLSESDLRFFLRNRPSHIVMDEIEAFLLGSVDFTGPFF